LVIFVSLGLLYIFVVVLLVLILFSHYWPRDWLEKASAKWASVEWDVTVCEPNKSTAYYRRWHYHRIDLCTSNH